MTNQGSGRRCVLCGGVPATKEHVIPKWISRAAKARGANEFGMASRAVIGADAPAVVPGEHVMHRMADFRTNRKVIDVEVKRVCEPCNRDWMGSVETEVHPFLEPMMFGESPARFSRQQGETLGWWTVKTVIMCNLANQVRPPFDLIPRRFYSWFRSTSPTDVAAISRVYVGKIDEAPDRFEMLMCYTKDSGRPEDLDYSDSVVFVLKLFRVALVGLLYTGAEGSAEELPELNTELMVDLFPATPDDFSVVWPGSLIPLTRANLDAFLRLGG